MYTPEDSPFEKFRTEKLKGVAMSPDALELVAKAYEGGFIDGMQKQMQSSVDRAVNRMAEQQAPVREDWGPGPHECHSLPEQPAQQEPFGYFKAEPFGWTDCAETDEGAVALYTAPQPAQQEPVAKDNSNYRLDPPWRLDPLYTTPQAQRKPLTGEQVTDGCRSLGVGAYQTLGAAFEAGVRFAEAAHNIKENT